MACGSARTHMSSSSTTTSDPHRSPKPPDSRVDSGVSRFSGRLDRAGFRRDSAGDPLQMPPDVDQGVSSNHDLGGDPESARADLADSIEDHPIVCERHLRRLPVSELVAPDLAQGCANLGASSRVPRACRVTRAAPPEALPTSMPLPQSGSSSAYAGSPRYAQKSISMPSRLSPSPGGRRHMWRLVWPKPSPGGFVLAGAISQAVMTAARATASKYSATVPGRIST
jgi:hypothetical protein